MSLSQEVNTDGHRAASVGDATAVVHDRRPLATSWSPSALTAYMKRALCKYARERHVPPA